ncbi:MAG TPA: response regulator transcription factor [Bacilli bacterium]
MEKIRVLLVEDDPIWRKSLAEYLSREDDILIVGAVETKDEAVQISRLVKIDIILMDINLTENRLDGIDAAIEINQIQKTKVIVLTGLNEEEIILNAFTAGVVNYVLKTEFRNIPNIIRSTHNTNPIEFLIKDYARLKQEEHLKELTPAEREVFELVELGYTQTQMEQKLHKAESTLKNQINTILKKLNVQSRKEAVQKVRGFGLFKSREEDPANSPVKY